MKICHVTSVHSLLDGRIFEKECCSLAKLGVEVYLVGIGETELRNGVHIIGIKTTNRGRIRRVLDLDRKVIDASLSLECNIYHLHDPELLRFAVEIKKKGHKVIFDSHEDVPRQIMSKYWIPKPLRRVVSAVYESKEKNICKKIDLVIGATDKIRDIFRNHGVKAESIFNYPVLGGENRRSPLNNQVLCFAGSLSQSNGIIELIGVVMELETVQLKLAGEFDPIVEKFFMENSNSRIQYLGVLSKEEVENLYLSSSLGVVVDLPTGNNVDGLPIKMFEYMKFGLPIITSDFPLRKSIFAKFTCGILVDPSDKESYKKAIVSILNNQEEGKLFADNGIQATRNIYNWESQEKKLMDIYKELS